MRQGYDNEAIYDEKIAPLMHEILQICKAEEIPMVATFYLKSGEGDEGPMSCTSWIRPEGNTPAHYPKLCEWARHGGEKPWFAAVTITRSGGNV
ncbi:hypothetical protein [Paenibacillus tyrfis]|uniref:hypothetical protein n=1 Tax=Paenibacillus tyrfis TaxID=1501230 RepID=UPI000B58F14C|nr:hypothetical protein [Paenibacillus tyrfis]